MDDWTVNPGKAAKHTFRTARKHTRARDGQLPTYINWIRSVCVSFLARTGRAAQRCYSVPGWMTPSTALSLICLESCNLIATLHPFVIYQIESFQISFLAFRGAYTGRVSCNRVWTIRRIWWLLRGDGEIVGLIRKEPGQCASKNKKRMVEE